jgi:hypothetical protein
MILLLSRTGLRYNENAIASDAQTERRGLAGPVRDLAWRLDLTGRLRHIRWNSAPGQTPAGTISCLTSSPARLWSERGPASLRCRPRASATPAARLPGASLTRIMHSRGRGRCWRECKSLKQQSLRAYSLLKRRKQSARPGLRWCVSGLDRSSGANPNPLGNPPGGTSGSSELCVGKGQGTSSLHSGDSSATSRLQADRVPESVCLRTVGVAVT